MPYTEHEFNRLQDEFLPQIETKDGLFRFAKNVLSNIDFSLQNHDFSSVELLRSHGKKDSRDERAIQTWLAEQIELRSGGDLQVTREKEVAKMKKPDIVVSSAGIRDEVVVEIKELRADSYSYNDLLCALKIQLFERYLKTENRNSGILFLLNYGSKQYWLHPDTRLRLEFHQLLDLLNKEAAKIIKDSARSINLEVFGISLKTYKV